MFIIDYSAKWTLTVSRFPQCWRQHCHPKKLTFSLKLSHFVSLSPASCSFSLPSLSFLNLWLSCDHSTCCRHTPCVLWSGFQDRRWRFGLTWENVLALTQGSTEWLHRERTWLVRLECASRIAEQPASRWHTPWGRLFSPSFSSLGGERADTAVTGS